MIQPVNSYNMYIYYYIMYSFVVFVTFADAPFTNERIIQYSLTSKDKMIL